MAMEPPPAKRCHVPCHVPCHVSSHVTRLGTILSCILCSQLPAAAVYVYQCSNGHLLCGACVCRLAADARLDADAPDVAPTCPACRVHVSKESLLRNLAAEKAASELPSRCVACGGDFPRNVLERHVLFDCEYRACACRYRRLGCPWTGLVPHVRQHERSCRYSSKSGRDLLPLLAHMDRDRDRCLRMRSQLLDLLSSEHVAFKDLRLRPNRCLHKLFYESRTFTAFNRQWSVKGEVVLTPTANATTSGERDQRSITYQLSVVSGFDEGPLLVHFLVLRGPFGDMKVNPRVHAHTFTHLHRRTHSHPLPLQGEGECDRLLADNYINCRLVMFGASVRS